MTPVIETAALSKMYGSTAALKGLNLRIERGEIFGLIGPNGAGKATTMRLLLDLIRPSSGHVRVFGQEPRAGGKSLRARLAFLPGELKLASMTTGRDLLSFYARLAGDTPPSVYEGLAERL